MANDLIPYGAGHPHLLHALSRKRAELAGQIDHHHGVARQLKIEMEHVDATLRMFCPTFEIDAIKPKPVPPPLAAFRGDVTPIVLTVLREAIVPVTAPEITEVLMRHRGLPLDDPKIVRIMVRRVAACLQAKRRRGLVRVAKKVGGLQGWELVR